MKFLNPEPWQGLSGLVTGPATLPLRGPLLHVLIWFSTGFRGVTTVVVSSAVLMLLVAFGLGRRGAAIAVVQEEEGGTRQ